MSIHFRLSRGVLGTMQPPVPRAVAWGAAATRPLLNMAQGAPGHPPADILLHALAAASKTSGYGYVLGRPDMRSSFAHEMKSVYGQTADITSQDVAISAGCNMAFVATIMCLADAGDQVILPVPWYFNHPMSLDLLGIKPVSLYTRSDQGFLPSVEECRSLITPKTRAIALVTPNNPTGVVYPPSLIAEFAELCREHNLALIIDETYRDFVEHFPPHNLFSSDSWRSTLVHLFSFSKSYAIPGHRLGAIVASPDLLRHVETTLDCLQICAPQPPQVALADPILLSDLRSTIKVDAEALRARHALFRSSIPARWRIGSQGGYYAYVQHPFRNSTLSSIEFCKLLAKEFGVLILPAQFFYSEQDEAQRRAQGMSEEGWDKWLRFSVANISDEQIVSVCERLKECEAYFE